MIRWVKNKEPGNFAGISKIMLPKDYIACQLSGSFCTDVSDASGILLSDVRNKRWSKEMTEICGITEDQSAAIYESADVVGTLKPELPARFGLPEAVKIAAGACGEYATVWEAAKKLVRIVDTVEPTPELVKNMK